MTWTPVSATSLFDGQRDGVVVIAPDDTIVYVNKNVQSYIGPFVDQIVGRPYSEIVPGVDTTTVSRWLTRVRDGRSSPARPIYVHGLRRWYEVDAHLDGGHVVCFVTDVTARQRRDAERRLLSAVSAHISTSETWKATVEGLADVLRVELGHDLAEVWRWSPQRQSIRLLSVRVDRDDDGLGAFVAATEALPPDPAALLDLVGGDRRVVTRRLSSDPSFRRAAAAADVGLHSAAHARLDLDPTTSLVVGVFRRGPIADDSDVILERCLDQISTSLAHRRSALELEHFFELSQEFVAITGLGGGFRRVNPAMVAALGYSEDEMLAAGFGTILHPDDVERTSAAIRDMVRTGRPVVEHESRMRTASGDYRWVSWKAQVFGSEGLVFSTGRDVTEERRERIRRETEAEVLQSVVAGHPLPVALRLLERIVERFDPSLRCEVALAAPEVGPSSGSDQPDQPDEPSDDVGAASAWSRPILGHDHEVLGTLEVFSRKPGEPGSDQIALVEDACRLAAVAIQRSRSDTALARSDERFRLLAEVITDAAWDWDIVAEDRWRNQGFWTLFGYEPIPLDGTDSWWRERVHPDDLGPLLESRQRALDSDADRWSHEYRFLRADGEYADVLVRGRIVRDQQGAAIRMVGGMTDITERRQGEREYLRAQRLESLGTMAGGISHDLNNSLMPILMAVDQLLTDEVDEDTREYLDVIAASARRSVDMVRRILGFARGLEGAAVTVPVGEVVGSAIRLMRDMFPKNIELVVDLAGVDGVIHGDTTQLQQVIMNLALNARDAMPDGGRLTVMVDEVVLDEPAVAAARRDPSGGMSEIVGGRYARIVVSDTGTGITAAVRDRLFEPFFTTKTRTDGTGLGLATSLAIIRGHGGGISVASQVGVGTTFVVHLPVETSSDARSDAPRPTSSPSPAGDTDLHAPHPGATVLVIDDEPAVGSVVLDVLSSAGYQVVETHDARSALRYLADHLGEIEIVLTDVMMPGMDGVQFVQAAREIAPDLLVVAMTGLDDPVRMASLSDAGVLTVLQKPFDRAVLLETVAVVLGAHEE